VGQREVRRPQEQVAGEEEIRELLRIRRKVKVSADDNFEIFGPDSLSKLWSQLTAGWCCS